MRFLLAILFCLVPSLSHAFFVDLNAIYFSDTFTTSTSQVSTRLLYDATAGIDIDNKGRFNVGWNVTSLSATDQSGSTTTTFTSFDMGPRFGYFISKDKTWSINAAYLLIGTGTYKVGSAAEEKLRGASIKADIGFMPQIGETVAFGIKLNYYAPAFTESLNSSGTVITKVSYTRSFMFPSLALSYRF